MEALERYEVLKVLQESEAGRVSLVWHKELKCRRILKEVSLYHPAGETLRSEVRILQKVKAQFFPAVIDSFETADKVCMIEEYVEGEELGIYLRRIKRVSAGELVRLSMELCEIVAFLHEPENQVLHLDIKPGNIVISDNRMKLVDFGSAICQRHGEGLRSGTIQFAAPELLTSGTLSEGTDIWSIGKTFEFMRMYAIKVPKGYDRIISRCLRQGKGYKKVTDILTDLKKINIRRAIPSGDNLMAVVGIPSGDHGTVFAIHMAEKCASKKKTVLLDCNPERKLEKLEEAEETSPRSRGFSFIHKGVLVGKRVESPDVTGWRGRGYATIICDLGSDYRAAYDIPYRKVFLTGSLTPWSKDSWSQAIDFLKDRTEIYAVVTENYGHVTLPELSKSHIITLTRGVNMRRVTRCI